MYKTFVCHQPVVVFDVSIAAPQPNKRSFTPLTPLLPLRWTGIKSRTKSKGSACDIVFLFCSGGQIRRGRRAPQLTYLVLPLDIARRNSFDTARECFLQRPRFLETRVSSRRPSRARARSGAWPTGTRLCPVAPAVSRAGFLRRRSSLR